MWNLPLRFICATHLVMEHNYIHQMYEAIKKGMSVKGFITGGFLDTKLIQTRHDDIEDEMSYRGFVSKRTPIQYKDKIKEGNISQLNAMIEIKKCEDCRKRIKANWTKECKEYAAQKEAFREDFKNQIAELSDMIRKENEEKKPEKIEPPRSEVNPDDFKNKPRKLNLKE